MLKSKVRPLIAKGNIKEAIDMMLENVDKKHQEIIDELIYLKSNYKLNKELYEIKMTISKADYDIAIAKNINAVQEVLRKLDEQKLEGNNNIEQKIKGKYSAKIIIPIIIIILVGYYLLKQNSNRSIEEENSQVFNIVGVWDAKVEKTGYSIDKGVKMYYEDAEAHWKIIINSDHTAFMSGTIDTTGKAKLDWYLNEKENSLRLIQEDQSSFEVKIIESNSERQIWKTDIKKGTKVEEWTWRLKRIE